MVRPLAPVPRVGTFPLTQGGRAPYSVRFKANSVLRLADEVRGFWSGPWYKTVAEANAKMASVVQQGMVDYLNEKIQGLGRPQGGRVGTWPHPANALQDSLLDERNRWVSAQGYIVGRKEWMDESPAQHYWRNIEWGRKGYTTTALFFGPAAEYADARGRMKPYVLPSRERYRENVQMPQHKGIRINVSPFPGHRYSDGARNTALAINPLQYYRDALGSSLAPIQIRGGKK